MPRRLVVGDVDIHRDLRPDRRGLASRGLKLAINRDNADLSSSPVGEKGRPGRGEEGGPGRGEEAGPVGVKKAGPAGSGKKAGPVG